MRTGTTKSGFKFEIDEKNLDDMQLLDLLIAADDGDTTALIKATDWMLGKEQKKRLYDHLRTEDGKVPIKDFTQEFLEIFNEAGKEGKN